MWRGLWSWGEIAGGDDGVGSPGERSVVGIVSVDNGYHTTELLAECTTQGSTVLKTTIAERDSRYDRNLTDQPRNMRTPSPPPQTQPPQLRQ